MLQAGAVLATTSRAATGCCSALDARVKVVALLGLLVAAALVHHVAVLRRRLYAGTLVLAAASRLPLAFFVKRVWLFVPIFTGVDRAARDAQLRHAGHIVVPLGLVRHPSASRARG